MLIPQVLGAVAQFEKPFIVSKRRACGFQSHTAARMALFDFIEG